MTREAHRILRAGSKSFAFATRLLPRETGDRAAVIYAWCRRADDAVDLCPPGDAPRAVARLRDELARIYAGGPSDDATVSAFAAVVRATGIPRAYPEALLDGMAADAAGTRYPTFDALYGYCFQVASTVGLMMSHVFGVRDDRALRHAAHLGIAMQLTNICRDVVEDERRDRVYLPAELLGGDLPPMQGGARTAAAVAALLRVAEDHYRSGDQGLPALPVTCAWAIRTARLIYAEIGGVIARRGFDVLGGRAVVSPGRKLWLVLRALAGTAAARIASPPRRLLRGWS